MKPEAPALMEAASFFWLLQTEKDTADSRKQLLIIKGTKTFLA
ncbi:hypothetical protein [Flavobacterium reichenbachii]|nr:hypothetical protein [Flavobacterium reichenbachii]